MRRYGFIVLALLYSTVVMSDGRFGRLFFTKEQRLGFDHLKSTPQQVVDNTESHAQLATQAKIQGYVKRSDVQQATVWVNGEAVQKELVDAKH